MEKKYRSGCPINLSLEVFGDSWSLLVLRDVMFGNRRTFRSLLTQSEEGIATNILANRLERLVGLGMLSVRPDEHHAQKKIYSLSEAAIQLVPVFVALGAWGRRHLPVSRELSIRAQVLEEGGDSLAQEFMDELRVLHLGASPRPGVSVLQRLQAAYEAEVVRGSPSLPRSSESTKMGG